MAQNIIFCCGPKIWTRAAGWLGMILALCYAIEAPLVTDQLAGMLHHMDKPRDAAALAYVSRSVCATLWTSCVISVLVNAFLLTGNEKERPGFLMPWLILSWMDMALVGTALLMCLFQGFFIAVLVLLVYTILPAIFLYAVHKRYAEIKELKEPKIPIPMYKV